tara:strand:- start:936 stop:1187 length:252 start_codon:yes stop_codon:yes gene_type:complete
MTQQREERPPSNHWHLDKRLSISHLMTTLMIAAAAFAYASGIETRLTALEVGQGYQHETNVRLNDSLAAINGKLDRLIERLSE